MFVYLYCVIDKSSLLEGPESLGEDLYSIYHEGLYAVVSRVKESEFSEDNFKKNLESLNWVKEKATLHEKVIEKIMKTATVIPFKFGTIFKSEDNLKAMLVEHRDELKENLKSLEGKEEWGVKLYCDLDRLREVLLKEDNDLAGIDKDITSSPPGRAFFLKKKKEELLDKSLNKKLNEYGRDSFEGLKAGSLEARLNRLLPREVTDRKDEMILNSAFLIRKDNVGNFISIVNALKSLYGNKGLFLDCTGPWPPYNFCKILKEKIPHG